MASWEQIRLRLEEFQRIGEAKEWEPGIAVARLRSEYFDLLDALQSLIPGMLEEIGRVHGLHDDWMRRTELAAREGSAELERDQEVLEELLRAMAAVKQRPRDLAARGRALEELQRRLRLAKDRRDAIGRRLLRIAAAEEEARRNIEGMRDLRLALERLAESHGTLGRKGLLYGFTGLVSVVVIKVLGFSTALLVALQVAHLVEPEAVRLLGTTAAFLALFLVTYLAVDPLLGRLRAAALWRTHRDMLGVLTDLMARLRHHDGEIQAVAARFERLAV